LSRFSDELDPWNVREDTFPNDGLMHSKLKFFLKYAILAPSIHNTQPWIFSLIDDNSIEIYADRRRTLRVIDPTCRELAISCGAALGYLLITIKHFGYKYKTELLPLTSGERRGNEDLLARVNVYDNSNSEGNSSNTEIHSLQEDDNNRLFGAITRRRTNRFRFEERTLPDILLAGFYYIAHKYPHYQYQSQVKKGDPIWLHMAEETEEKNALAELVARGDRLQSSDKHFRGELTSWVNLNRTHRRDGIPGYALELCHFLRLGPFAVRRFNISKKRAELNRESAIRSSALAVLGSYSDRPLDWIITGMALANILLLARSEDIWCSFLNQPIQIPELRHKVIDTIKKERAFPQVLLRIGYYSHDIRPTPRRNLEEVIC
jgi:nitroreductase